MYADKVTPAMRTAIDETDRRRAKQVAYNVERGLDPMPLRKKLASILDDLVREANEAQGGSGRSQSRGKSAGPGHGRGAATGAAAGRHVAELASLPRADLANLIQQLDDQMHEAARELQFEVAGRLRDEINDLKRELRGMQAAGV
jgi:excinuclease ABC subunit B